MKNNEIEKIRRTLEHRIEEWVGSDTPTVGSDDHDRWLGMIQEVKDIVLPPRRFNLRWPEGTAGLRCWNRGR